MSWTGDLRRILERLLQGKETAATPSDQVTCHEAASRVYEWLDGELPPELADRVGAHLETCARCYPMLVFEKSFLEAVSSVADDAPPPERLKERVLRSLETEGFTAK
ncbi:MAG: zf-HC2 domain-containing protein [Gemmatimonadota bacterium]